MKALRKSKSERNVGVAISFPEHITCRISEKLDQGPTQELLLLRNVVECKDPLKQLSLLREISNKLDTFRSQHWDLLANMLIRGLFHCEGNSTLCSAITGILNRLSEQEVNSLVHLFTSEMETSRRTDTVTVIGMLLHFNNGQKIISNNLTSITYLKTAIEQCLNTLKELSPSVDAATIYIELHNIIRTLLSLIRVQKEGTEDLLETITHCLNLPGIPMDIGGNCSKILILLLASHQDGIQQIVSRFSKESVSSHHGNLEHLNVSTETTLNMCNSLLTMLELSALSQRVSSLTLMGDFILANILKSSSSEHDASVAILRARCLESWLQKGLEMMKCAEVKSSFIEVWDSFENPLLEFIFNSMEQQVDAVRYAAKEAFQNFLEIYLLVDGDPKKILQRVLHLPRLKKSKYMALSCIARSTLATLLVEMDPNLADELLDAAKDASLCNQAKDTYNSLMTSVGSFDSWIRPLLEAIGEHPQSQSFETCFADLLKWQPGLLNSLNDWYMQDKSRLRVYIIALLAARKMGILETPAEPEVGTWNGMIPDEVLVSALEHSSDKIRLNALTLIVEGPKSTQTFSRAELEHVKRFVELNMGNPSASFRQQMASSIQKFLVKLRDSGASLRRRPEEQWRAESYTEWVRWLVNRCLDHLAPDSNFSRRFLALQLIQSANRTFGWVVPVQLPDSASLVDCLFDSFESNQQTALELLQDPHLRDFYGRQMALVQFYPDSATALAGSIRPADTNAASYLFRWMTHWPVHVGLDRADWPIRKEWTHLTSNALRLTVQLTTLLRDHLNSALSQSGAWGPLRQLISVPVYGLLASIRSLLIDQQTRSNEMDAEPWKRLTAHIVDLCFGCSRLAAPVVTNESPEGFLPADASHSDRTGCDAQSLLVSAWRTIKEVSLLFGRMAGWILTPELNRLLDQSTVIELGDHLKRLLLETKHRGAFEQVHCGFSQLCAALWRSADEKLRSLPADWLRQVMQDLRSSETAAKLCRTRRSAGLPFMIQAILAPPAEFSTRPEVLDEALKDLLDIASGSEPEGRLHALNILRMLFRDARLGQLIGPHVARALILAIDGFEAPLWPERNASTLLFSALMTRIFGVPRSKTDIQKRNALTGRVFFQMHPQLYPYLLDRLRRCTGNLDSGLDLHPALFPVLLLLARLQAPSGHADVSVFSLEPFIPLVQACAASSVLKTRQLAAQALIPLLTPEASAGLLIQLLERIPSLRKHNELHGTLLQVQCLVNERPNVVRMPGTDSKVELLFCLADNRSDVIRCEFLRIMEAVQTSLRPEFRKTLFDHCMEQIRSPTSQKPEPFRPLYLRQAVRICGFLEPESSKLTHLLEHPLYEIRQEFMELVEHNRIRPDLSGSAPHLVAMATQGDSLALSLLGRKPLLDQRWVADRRNLEWALELFRTARNDSVRCATLLTASRVIGNEGDGVDAELMNRWVDYLTEVENVEASPQFRKVCAESLYICRQILSHPPCGILASKLWICLFRCLTDDDDSVRNSAAGTVDKLTDRLNPSHSFVAMEAAGDFFVERIASAHPLEALLALLHLSFDSGTSSASAESNAFEKGDSDSSGEPLIRTGFYTALIRRSVARNSPESFDSETIRRLIRSLAGNRLFDEAIPPTSGEILLAILQHQFDSVDADVDADDINQRRCVIDLSIGLSQLILVADSLSLLDIRLVQFRQQAAQVLRRRIPEHLIVRSVINVVDV